MNEMIRGEALLSNLSFSATLKYSKIRSTDIRSFFVIFVRSGESLFPLAFGFKLYVPVNNVKVLPWLKQ